MKDRFCKKNILSALALSAVVALTVFFFSPVDIYLSSQRDFPIRFSSLALPMLLVALAVMAVLMLVFMLCLMINKKLFNVVMCIAAGIEGSFYTQMMFMNGRMKELNGTTVDFTDKPVLNSINSIVFYLMAFVPLFLFVWVEQKKPDLKKYANIRLVGLFSCVLIAMQTVGSVSLIAKNGVKNTDDEQYTSYFSYENAMSLSKDKNVVIFLVDTLDGLWMDEIIERYPEVEDEFDGFTYYRNNTPTYSGTFPSVIQMLSGVQYADSELDDKDYIRECWTTDNPMKKMKRNGYNVNLYLDSYASMEDYDLVKDSCDNICMNAQCEVSANYFRSPDAENPDGIVPMMSLMSAAKILPYTIKDLIFENMPDNFQDSFIIVREDDIPERMAPAVTVETDLKFSRYVDEHDITDGNEKPVFSFIHLNGAHNQSDELGAVYKDNSGEHDVNYTTRGDLQIVFNYMEKMKQAGVYDNSTIIVLADHGFGYAVAKNKTLTEPRIASLLIKGEGEHGAMKYNSEAELSNQNFTASICEYTGLEHSQYDESYNDIIKSDKHHVRHMYVNYLKHLYPFEIYDDARELDNWKYVESFD